MRCPECNTENPDGMKFCCACGRKLEGKSVSNVSVNAWKPLLLKALKILYILSGAVVILLVISLSKYDTKIEKHWEACEGHCIEISVLVTSPLTWVMDYEMEAFNYNPPCSYAHKSHGLLTPHKPASDANLAEFKKMAIDNYKEKVWLNIAMYAVITLLFYGLYTYFNKKNQSAGV